MTISSTAGGSGGGAASAPVTGAVAAEEAPFVPLLVLSAMTVAFAHGANDLANSIGVRLIDCDWLDEL